MEADNVAESDAVTLDFAVDVVASWGVVDDAALLNALTLSLTRARTVKVLIALMSYSTRLPSHLCPSSCSLMSSTMRSPTMTRSSSPMTFSMTFKKEIVCYLNRRVGYLPALRLHEYNHVIARSRWGVEGRLVDLLFPFGGFSQTKNQGLCSPQPPALLQPQTASDVLGASRIPSLLMMFRGF